jgi:RND family efflux transporter MFP subunit
VVDRLKADLGAARARAELARGEAKRGEALIATKAISTDTYETRVQAAVQAEEAVHSAEAALKLAELDLEFTEVRAPIAGRISNARVTAGNLVTGGSTANTTLLTTIVSPDPLFCYFEADEASVLRYRQLHREGKRTSALFGPIPAEMALGNEMGFPHQGTVDFVDNQINPATGTIRARAVFANPDKLMSPGFFARIRIPGSGEYDAVLVRDSAISSDQGRLFVLTVDDKNKTVYRPIKTGPIVDGLRVVREGLDANDRVIVSGLMSARPGVPVQPQAVPMSTNVLVSATAPTASKP